MSEVMDWHCQHMPKACRSYDHATQEIEKKELVFLRKVSELKVNFNQAY